MGGLFSFPRVLASEPTVGGQSFIRLDDGPSATGCATPSLTARSSTTQTALASRAPGRSALSPRSAARLRPQRPRPRIQLSVRAAVSCEDGTTMPSSLPVRTRCRGRSVDRRPVSRVVPRPRGSTPAVPQCAGRPRCGRSCVLAIPRSAAVARRSESATTRTRVSPRALPDREPGEIACPPGHPPESLES
jgi:hypothetical protein